MMLLLLLATFFLEVCYILRSLGSPLDGAKNPKISCVRPPIYHTRRVWSPERGVPPRPGTPPGRGRPPPHHTGAIFRGPGAIWEPSVTEQGVLEVWGSPGARASWPRRFSGDPPYGKWWRNPGSGTGWGADFGGPGAPGAVSAQFWPGRNGINFLTLFRAGFRKFLIFALEYYILVVKLHVCRY